MKKKMYCRMFSLAGLVALFLAGCSAPKTGGRIVPHSKAYGNVVSLSPSTTQLIAENGGFSFLAGRTESCDLPQYVKGLKVVMKGTKPDYEAIMSADPDIIVYDKSLFSDDETAKIKELKVETMEYGPRTLKDYTDFCYRISSKLGVEMLTSQYVDRILNSEMAAAAIDTGRPKITIMVGTREQGYMIMGKDGFHAEILNASGGTGVGADGDKFVNANIEKLIEMDPEVIYSDNHSDEIYDDPRLQNITAVKNLNVYDMDGRYLIRMCSALDETITTISNALKRLPQNPRGPAKP